jgi:S-adenosyl-L-methionine hydrolase (adenosine-forming)
MIVFLSDFGQKDGYVAAVKGAIRCINPGVEIIDLSHQISSQNVDEASFVLWNTYKSFPKKTVFISVVDPGVGSDRGLIVLKTKKYIFVAPDNGLLKYILAEEKKYKTYTVEIERLHLNKVSHTFHGRDIFAPLCAMLSKDTSIKKLGKKIEIKKTETFIRVKKNKAIYEGKVIYIDHFGNAITNLKINNRFNGEIEILKHRIKKISKSYYIGKRGELIALISSANLLEIAINCENASKKLKIEIGDLVRFHQN